MEGTQAPLSTAFPLRPHARLLCRAQPPSSLEISAPGRPKGSNVNILIFNSKSFYNALLKSIFLNELQQFIFSQRLQGSSPNTL